MVWYENKIKENREQKSDENPKLKKKQKPKLLYTCDRLFAHKKTLNQIHIIK